MSSSVRMREVKEIDPMWMNSSSKSSNAPNMMTLPKKLKNNINI
jgi:hypothetical protein